MEALREIPQVVSSQQTLGIDHPIAAEEAFGVLALGTKVFSRSVICRGSANCINKKEKVFYVSEKYGRTASDAEGNDDDMQVEFEKIADAEDVWWSGYKHEGHRLGIAVRQMSQPPASGGGVGSKRSNDASDTNFQGRWFCLVRARIEEFSPLADSADGSSPSANVVSPEEIPNSYSFVQIWETIPEGGEVEGDGEDEDKDEDEERPRKKATLSAEVEVSEVPETYDLTVIP